MINWTAIATGGAAIATAVAAAFTAYMANQTKKSAQAAENSAVQSAKELRVLETQAELLAKQTSAITEQARLARMALAQGSTPLLVPVLAYEFVVPDNPNQSSPNKLYTPKVSRDGSRVFVEGNLLWFYVELRNVGTGLAVVANLEDDPGSDLTSCQISSSALSKPSDGSLRIHQPIIPAGESATFRGVIDLDGQLSLQRLREPDSTNKAIFTYQDLSRSRTFQLSFRFGVIDDMLAPNQITFTGYDLPEESNKG